MEQRLLRAKQLDLEQKQKLEDKEEKSNNLKMKLTAENQEKAGRYRLLILTDSINCWNYWRLIMKYAMQMMEEIHLLLVMDLQCIWLWFFKLIFMLCWCYRVRAALLQRQQEAEQRRKAEEMAKLREYVTIFINYITLFMWIVSRPWT